MGKIDQYPECTDPADSDLLVIETAEGTKKIEKNKLVQSESLELIDITKLAPKDSYNGSVCYKMGKMVIVHINFDSGEEKLDPQTIITGLPIPDRSYYHFALGKYGVTVHHDGTLQFNQTLIAGEYESINGTIIYFANE